jgi:hypothetical protein
MAARASPRIVRCDAPVGQRDPPAARPPVRVQTERRDDTARPQVPAAVQAHAPARARAARSGHGRLEPAQPDARKAAVHMCLEQRERWGAVSGVDPVVKGEAPQRFRPPIAVVHPRERSASMPIPLARRAQSASAPA